MSTYSYSVENLKVFLNDMPHDLLSHTYGFLPRGHPIFLSHKMNEAFRICSHIKELTDRETVKICAIVSNIFDYLIDYSGYLNEFVSLYNKSFSKMPVLLSRFGQRLPLHFNLNIRYKARLTMAECFKNKVLESKFLLDYDTHLFAPIIPLRIPYFNQFGVAYHEPYLEREEAILRDLDAYYNDRIIVNNSQMFPYCKCCGKVSQIQWEVPIAKIISKFSLADTLIEKTDFTMKLAGAVLPVELSSLFVCKIIEKIEKLREESSDFFVSYAKPKTQNNSQKKFAGFLKEDIRKRISSLEIEIRNRNQIPAGSSDIPEILRMTDAFFKLPDDHDERVVEEGVLQQANICVNIQVSDENDRSWDHLLDTVTWMDHNFRLRGIVELALKLASKGYHVSLR